MITLRYSYCLIVWFLALGISNHAVAAPSGEEFYKTVIESTPIYEDPKLQEYIKQLGEKIVAQSEMAGEKFTFTLLDSPNLNAFATRDNYIYVNRGLLAYVRNEAQLVSVLAHEVAHVTRGHVTGQEGSATSAQILSAIAAVLANSNEVYEAGMAYANSMIRGHGRRNELEADESGAEYMAKLGYDPNEMLAMLSIMKDYETLQKARAKSKGASKQTYHGIFSTHPRNDSRLRTVVSKAKSIDSSTSRDNGVSRYRQVTQGLIWGENFLAKEKLPQRYSNMQLRVRFDFPDEWQQTNAALPLLVVGQPEEKQAKLTLSVMNRSSQGPEEYLYNQLNFPQLKEGKSIEPARLKGYTGVLKGEGKKPDVRIALIYYKLKAYLFRGEVSDVKSFKEYDEFFLKSIDTFRPISSREIAGQKPVSIHYVKATPATTFDKLAVALRLNSSEKDDLRLINGYYPRGEPKPGDWIKIYRQ
jgi:predicted Zn-dependent protease